MQERVRICDIAEELGLSTATVSNVIHGHTLRDGFLASVLLPLFVCEASWSLGENVYAAIYGRMGTEQSAAMTLTAPIQGLAIGALCGLSQAAGVIVGKRLGGEDYDGACRAAKRLMVYGAVGASVLCAARCRAT
jgi:putative adhesin